MRRRTLVLTAATALAVAPLPAAAAWNAPGSGTAPAQARSLAGPGHVTAGQTTSSTAALSWGAAAPLPSGTTSYLVERAPFGAATGWVPACGGAALTATSCSDTGLTAATDYHYRVTSVYARWRTVGAPSGRVTTAAAVAGTGTALRFTACQSGSRTIGRNETFSSTVQVLDARGGLVADNPAELKVAVSVSGTGVGSVSPPSLVVPPRSSVTSDAAALTSADNNGKATFVLTAARAGSSAATCTFTK